MVVTNSEKKKVDNQVKGQYAKRFGCTLLQKPASQNMREHE